MLNPHFVMQCLNVGAEINLALLCGLVDYLIPMSQ